jgi:Tol biopolymer transport system component
MNTKNSLIALLTLILLSTACSPQMAANPTQTPEPPTITITPSVTPTSLPTATSTPLPPAGKIVIAEKNIELIALPADPTYEVADRNILIPAEEFEKDFPALGDKGLATFSPFLSPDGKKLAVITCKSFMYSCLNTRIYLSTVERNQKIEFTTYNGGLMTWSPDSSYVMFQDAQNPERKKIISVRSDDFGSVRDLPPAQTAIWSYDSKQIYYFKNDWHIIDVNGENDQVIPCPLCAMVPSLSSFVAAQSPDGQYIAIGYMDGTLIIVRSNDFSNFKIGNAGGYISRLAWSPDSQKVAVNVNTTSDASDIIIMDTAATILEKMDRPEKVNIILLCNWSPDNRYIGFLSIEQTGYGLFLHEIAGQTYRRLFVETPNQNCPVWIE